MEEATRHLEVIQPAVRHAFSVPGVLSLPELRYAGGFMSCRRQVVGTQEAVQYVELFYRLAHPKNLLVRVQPGAAAGVEPSIQVSPCLCCSR